MRVVRYDVGEVRGVTDLPSGGIRIESALARVGVFPYSDTNGKTWHEYLPPEEAFKADSLDTLRGATVTDLHPTELVTASNYSSLTKGHVMSDVRSDGDLVVATLTILDSEEVRRVKAKERRETSCGYTCAVDWTAGVTPEGVKYDAIQRDRQYNHVALGPSGWGRAGPRVALRMDGAACQVETLMPMFTYKGKSYRCDSPEEMATAEKVVVDADAEQASAMEKLQSMLTEALTSLATIRAQTEAAKAVKQPETPPAEPMAPEVLDAAIEKRIVLKASAATILGETVKLDGLSNLAIQKAVVTKLLPEFKTDSMSTDTIEGMYQGIVAARRNDGLAELHKTVVKTDATDEDYDPEERMKTRIGNAWRAA